MSFLTKRDLDLVLSLMALASSALAAQHRPALGINLSGPADWNTELPFVDVFRLSRPWISQQEGQAWGKGPPLDLDEHGWVRSLQPGCYAETLTCTIEGGHYPAGLYSLIYKGQGQLDAWGAARVVQRQEGRLVLDVDPSKGAIFIRLTKTEPNDYIRDIRLVMPGFEQTFQKDPFEPRFIRRWQGVRCLRFMDWMQTNNSTIVHWSDRPTLKSASFSAKGVAVEWMIDLCNRLHADPWFCMPHMADDQFVRGFAQIVKAGLDPDLKVYIEYSNEVWNGIFQQHHWAAQQGLRLGLAEKGWEAAWRYYALRSVEIFQIWQDVFGGTDRLVRVLASQAANPYVSEQILGFQDAYRHADALAIAPYISFNVPQDRPDPNARTVSSWTLDQVLDYVEGRSLPEAIGWINTQKKVADRFGLALIAYEAGQHLVGVGGAENNQALTDLFLAANRHLRMGQIYDRYYNAWEQAGGGLLCYFCSISRWSKWGSWGIMEYYDQDPGQCPKFTSTIQWARRLGQPMNLP